LDSFGIITNYTWTFTYEGLHITLYGISPNFVFWATGDYPVVLTVRDAAGNEAMDTLVITVNDSEEENIVIIIGPVLDKTGHPVPDANVNVTVGGVTYMGITNASGYASILLPASACGDELSITISKNNYITVSYTPILDQDGSLNENPPTLEESSVAVEDNSGFGTFTWIIIILAIIAIVTSLGLLSMRRRVGLTEPATEQVQQSVFDNSGTTIQTSEMNPPLPPPPRTSLPRPPRPLPPPPQHTVAIQTPPMHEQELRLKKLYDDKRISKELYEEKMKKLKK
jgi:hypothetical protein